MTTADDRARLTQIGTNVAAGFLFANDKADLLRMAEDGIASREREAEKDKRLAELWEDRCSWRDGFREEMARANKAEAAVERVRALCEQARSRPGVASVAWSFAGTILAALDGPERPTAPAPPTTDGGA